ncbi:MAG: hypothetical protein AAF961_19195, partial [Planctomycetota bacterium]
ALGGLPSGDFIVAGGANLTTEWTKLLAATDRRLTRAFPQVFDLPGIDEQGLDDVEQSTRAMLDGVNRITFVALPSSKGEALFSNAFAMVDVEEASVYLESLKRSFELENRVGERVEPEIRFDWSIESFQIDEAAGYKFGVDLARAAADPNVPQWDGIVRRFCGEDGELWLYALPVDGDRAVLCVESCDKLAALRASLRNGDSALAGRDDIRATFKLMDKSAPWRLYVSPDQTLDFVQRYLEAFFKQLGGVALLAPAPKYPAAPPVGFTLQLTQRQLQAEVVWPNASIDALAAFIKAYRHDD